MDDLIESNIRRRGEIGESAKKIGLRIKELERLYGIKQGGSGYYGNQYEESRNNFVTPKTQEQLAKDMGMTVQNLQNYKLLADMIPELDDLVTTGIVIADLDAHLLLIISCVKDFWGKFAFLGCEWGLVGVREIKPDLGK